MITFSQFVESKMNSYVNQTVASQLNNMGINTFKGVLPRGFRHITPKEADRMNLPSDYHVVAGADGGYALWNYDDENWIPLPIKYMPVGTFRIGKGTKIPNMSHPTSYDPLSPTSPEFPSSDDDYYDRPYHK